MAEPNDWGSATTPYINAKGVPMTREHILRGRSRDYIDPDEHLGFAGYLLVCDANFTRRNTIGIFDMPDQPWRDWYDERLEPTAAIRQMMENEGALLEE